MKLVTFAAVFVACIGSLWGQSDGDVIRLRLAEAPSNAISPLLFGQFLECLPLKNPERGPEGALIPGTHELQPGVVEAMQELEAPIIRFPGGMVVPSLYDWTKMIDHSPFREGGRPEGYFFGLPEYFDLCEELGAEPLVVVNFRAAVWGTEPGELPMSAEQLAASQVAYCNLPQGTELPEGMPDWPAIRALNGHPEPHNVRYFQIGNEWVAWLGATTNVRKALGKEPFPDDAAQAAHIAQRLLDVIAAMRAIDPEIKIIIDAVMWEEEHEALIRPVLSDPRVREAADFATVHLYRTWEVDRLEKDGKPIELDRLTAEELWYATVAAPDMDAHGLSVIRSKPWSLVRELDWPTTMTEWNWNGWGIEREGATLWPRALGVAGFLHAILRDSQHLELATQSMMVGNYWTINGVRVDPSGEDAPFVVPSGRMTGFYAEHSGDQFIPVTLENLPTRTQPIHMGNKAPSPVVSMVDAVATANADTLYIHLLNRDKDAAHRVSLDLGERSFKDMATAHRMTGTNWNPQTELFVHPNAYEESSEPIDLKASKNTVTLPPASVTILEIPLTQ